MLTRPLPPPPPMAPYASLSAVSSAPLSIERVGTGPGWQQALASAEAEKPGRGQGDMRLGSLCAPVSPDLSLSYTPE